ncbi:hypothetical protein Vretimale_288 [Volvox reticuliferus]|uniref:Uncharacterized protein n=1 Tax=Volvox reticuliferus TaxID=1737510 RepID=A0A8J4D370_9CHLO|nr:hypothetical protein Vretifemale_2616 [Volvox reticuliferus]GIL94118.1 hypothetical protein Vretimale_288 [Volvox reticuliferus]
MAASKALGRAFLAAGGTMVFVFGATAVVSGASMAIVKAVTDRQKAKTQVQCNICSSKRRVVCEVCEGKRRCMCPHCHRLFVGGDLREMSHDKRCALPGERITKYWPTSEPPASTSHAWSVCAMCEGAGEHACINCVGTGHVNIYPWETDGSPLTDMLVGTASSSVVP